MRWRVHPTWRVGAETKEFAPSFRRTRLSARLLAFQLRRRHQSFVDFGVTIDRVDRALSEETEASRVAASAEGWPRTDHCEGPGDLTLCGLALSSVDSYSDPKWFLSQRAVDQRKWKQCPACREALADQGN
jgi:hypothetical protein